MKKRTTIILTGVLCAVSIAVGAVATEIVREIKAELRPDFTIVVDGKVKTFKNAQGEKVEPILYDGTTYLPLRAIGEIMGKTVFWYEAEKKVELKDSTVTDADVIVAGSETLAPSQPTATQVLEQKPAANKSEFISKDAAQEIALQKAGLSSADVKFDRVELDEDDGIWHYEVEFKNGLTEYDADIKADDGTILKWEVDLDD